MKYAVLGAVALTVSAGMAQAATYEYDFKKEANASGQIGEAIFSEFNTSTNGVFAGPNLKVTATKGQSDAFVYFDNGNAGMGVCGSPKTGATVNSYNSGSGTNVCSDAGDDGLTTTTESLHFTATNQAVQITEFYINSNHDKTAPIGSTVWNIGGTEYSAPFAVESLSQTGDIKISVNFFLNVGETLSLRGVSGPDSYISGIGLTPVPLPAAGFMLLAGLGGLGALRARKKA